MHRSLPPHTCGKPINTDRLGSQSFNSTSFLIRLCLVSTSDHSVLLMLSFKSVSIRYARLRLSKIISLVFQVSVWCMSTRGFDTPTPGRWIKTPILSGDGVAIQILLICLDRFVTLGTFSGGHMSARWFFSQKIVLYASITHKTLPSWMRYGIVRIFARLSACRDIWTPILLLMGIHFLRVWVIH